MTHLLFPGLFKDTAATEQLDEVPGASVTLV